MTQQSRAPGSVFFETEPVLFWQLRVVSMPADDGASAKKWRTYFFYVHTKTLTKIHKKEKQIS